MPESEFRILEGESEQNEILKQALGNQELHCIRQTDCSGTISPIVWIGLGIVTGFVVSTALSQPNR